MGIESLPLVVFLLLPGFISWFIFCWGTISRKISQIQHVCISLIFSLLAFTLAYYFVLLVKFIAIYIFQASWNLNTYPEYMQIIVNPQILPPELWLGIYVIAILFGFCLISLYRNGTFVRILGKLGLDLYGPEGVWYRIFHQSDFITLYLNDGSIIAGWPTHFSQTGEKGYSELYITKVQYFINDDWVKPDESVDGILINTDMISRIEFRKPTIIDNPAISENPPNKRLGMFWTEFLTRFFVWSFGLMLACITVIETINSLPSNISLLLLVSLIVFMIAALITWYFDIYRIFHSKNK